MSVEANICDNRKGILLAGGLGSRLYPCTNAVSKQLLPVYNKPMIYYSLSTLMLTGIRDIAVIIDERDKLAFKRLIGNGRKWGINIEYIVQPEPNGLPEAFVLADRFLHGQPSVLMLGDNIFFGGGLSGVLQTACQSNRASILGYRVADPERFGVIRFGQAGNIVDLIEKPTFPDSNIAVTGIYFVDERAPHISSELSPSDRGETEIVDLLKGYLAEGVLDAHILNRGVAWLDTGTVQSLSRASNYVEAVETRQGLLIGSPEEIALRKGWVDPDQIAASFSAKEAKSDYGSKVLQIVNELA